MEAFAFLAFVWQEVTLLLNRVTSRKIPYTAVKNKIIPTKREILLFLLLRLAFLKIKHHPFLFAVLALTIAKEKRMVFKVSL